MPHRLPPPPRAAAPSLLAWPPSAASVWNVDSPVFSILPQAAAMWSLRRCAPDGQRRSTTCTRLPGATRPRCCSATGRRSRLAATRCWCSASASGRRPARCPRCALQILSAPTAPAASECPLKGTLSGMLFDGGRPMGDEFRPAAWRRTQRIAGTERVVLSLQFTAFLHNQSSQPLRVKQCRSTWRC